MTEMKLALLVPLFFSFSFSRVQASSFIAPTICFALLTTTLGFLELYITKKKRFCFFIPKTSWNQLYTIKSIFGLVAVKLCRCQRYCTWKKFSSSSQRVSLDFYFILLKKTFFTCVWLSDAVLESSF